MNNGCMDAACSIGSRDNASEPKWDGLPFLCPDPYSSCLRLTQGVHCGSFLEECFDAIRSRDFDGCKVSKRETVSRIGVYHERNTTTVRGHQGCTKDNCC